MVCEDAVITELFQSFNQDNVILYVGSEAYKNGELTEKLCNLPWSCVVTTQRKDDFGTLFASGRSPYRYLSISELPLNLFNRDSLPIIQMFGSETELPAGTDDVDEILRPSFLKKQAEKILNRLMSKMDIRSRLVVIGYNPNLHEDISVETFLISCQEIQGGRITFFNSSNDSFELLEKYAVKNGYSWIKGKLSDAINSIEEEFDDQIFFAESDTNLFFKGQQPVFIKKSIVSRSRNFAQLLTEEKIREVRPLGRVQQSRWFYNFLNYSSDSPQWYGFLPQSDFYVKRSYEDELISLVRNLLRGKGRVKSDWNTPIILEGDPGSSKSVELAAVAYKIYEEKRNPVIFINNEGLNFAGQSNEIQILDELMQEIENVGEKDTRFLIVWDSSAYKNIATEAKQLSHELENRGRRFVLLCTAYSNIPTEKEKQARSYFALQTDNKMEKTNDESTVYYYNNCYFVQATREMESKEINLLKQKARLYSVADKVAIDNVWKELEGTNDIFHYFYRLIILIRPKLEAGLSKEQRLINRYVNRQLALAEKKIVVEEDNPIIEALRKAGIDVDSSFKREFELENVNDEIYDLDKFNACIAMFSRFKLKTPYSLALWMLCKDKDDYFGKRSQYNNYDLFRLLTTQINYIHYFEQSDGRYVFKFRSPLEADIFLKSNQINEDKQLAMVTEMIDHYVETYRKNNEVDYELKEAIQSILKMYGPNTEYKGFWKEHALHSYHQGILRKLEPLADKVYELRTKHHIPDEDGGMALIEISFYRELFGSMWDRLNGYSRMVCENRNPWEIYPEKYSEESYKKRLNKLAAVSSLALDSLEKLERVLLDANTYLSKRSIQTSINSLTVELASVNGEMESIKKEYEIFTGIEYDSKETRPLNYAQLSPILFKAISASPLDGYLYNALFKLFEKEYEKSGEERRLYLLSDIGMIADDASTLEITSRGANDRDELSIHLNRIAQYAGRNQVRIEDILNNTASESFSKLFESLIERNNASGICFVCQQELDDVGLGGKDISEYERLTGKGYVLKNEQLEVCKKIADFIKAPEYENCIENSIQALYLLLRVQWMLFNRRPLSIGREWQKTYLTEHDWLDVYTTCEKYESISGTSVRPVVTLIYALAKIQIEKDYLGAVKAMHRVSDMPNQRMRVPYLICFEPGKPQKYSGSVMSIHNYSGFLKVDGLPYFSEKNQGVKFYMKNLGLRSMPQKNKQLKEFSLGLSMANQFSAYVLEEEEEENEK